MYESRKATVVKYHWRNLPRCFDTLRQYRFDVLLFDQMTEEVPDSMSEFLTEKIVGLTINKHIKINQSFCIRILTNKPCCVFAVHTDSSC